MIPIFPKGGKDALLGLDDCGFSCHFDSWWFLLFYRQNSG